MHANSERRFPHSPSPCASLALLLVTPLAAQTTTRISIATGGAQADSESFASALSADGRIVAFMSTATNLVSGDTNNRYDIFTHDRLTGTTERVSVATGGAQGTSFNSALTFTGPVISDDGRFVAFESTHTNLVMAGSTGGSNIFVRDRLAATTELVSVNPSGNYGAGSSTNPSISSDGRYVAFSSPGFDLVAVDLFLGADVFVRDRQTGTTELVSISSTGAPADGFSVISAISADGRFVAFDSVSTTFAASDTNGTYDVFVRDRQAGTTEHISVSTAGVGANAAAAAPSMSSDGRFVVFHSGATNLVAGDTNGVVDTFVRDRLLGTTELVSVASDGTQGNGASGTAKISADGRYVAFTSASNNFVAGDTNLVDDIFIRDRLLGRTERISTTDAGGQTNHLSRFPAISADGRVVSFGSRATNIVAGDTNNDYDVFVHERALNDFEPFCSGDGAANGGPACPCGNDVVPGIPRGCTNSTGRGGSLAGTGNVSLTADTLTLTGTALAPSSFALFVQSSTAASGIPGETYFFDGLRCVGTSIVRLATKQSVAGAAAIGGPGMPISLLGGVSAPATRYYQIVYRNNAGPCDFLANSTNGLAVTWRP